MLILLLNGVKGEFTTIMARLTGQIFKDAVRCYDEAWQAYMYMICMSRQVS